ANIVELEVAVIARAHHPRVSVVIDAVHLQRPRQRPHVGVGSRDLGADVGTLQIADGDRRQNRDHGDANQKFYQGEGVSFPHVSNSNSREFHPTLNPWTTKERAIGIDESSLAPWYVSSSMINKPKLSGLWEPSSLAI